MAINVHNLTVSNMTVGPLSGGGNGGGGGGGYSIPIETSGLQIWWDASQYGGSGTTLSDLSGNSNDGTITNAPTYVSDGDKSYFDISNINPSANGSHGITNTNSSYYGIASDASFTISFWIQGTNSGGNQTAAALRARSSGESHKVVLRSGGTTAYSIVTSPTTSNNTDLWSSINYGGGSWISITSVADGSANSLKIYANGSLVDTNSSIQDLDGTQATVFAIGYDPYAYPYAGPNGLVAKWNNAALYNRALSASEVLSNYNALSSRFS